MKTVILNISLTDKLTGYFITSIALIVKDSVVIDLLEEAKKSFIVKEYSVREINDDTITGRSPILDGFNNG
jgi:hypothetical protein